LTEICTNITIKSPLAVPDGTLIVTGDADGVVVLEIVELTNDGSVEAAMPPVPPVVDVPAVETPPRPPEATEV
jgi:hypothetical protein